MKKHLPILVWIAAAALLCVFFARLGTGAARGDLMQIFLLYGSLIVGVLGLVTHTVLYREDNVSSVNFGYKLLAEAIVLLAIAAAMCKEIFF